ncbi:hypothetical protein [Ferrovibrio sp.]|uniref:hypothetical protein n=1 Tax=Ferrovibrio sp. TaxID=1917215 RepID=UPI001B6C1C22|nr:hypothetical protein [Ferrovibrio sp.]MBP7066361.1 hypothetical protein [Ferrovibrio sp.]
MKAALAIHLIFFEYSRHRHTGRHGTRRRTIHVFFKELVDGRPAPTMTAVLWLLPEA